MIKIIVMKKFLMSILVLCLAVIAYAQNGFQVPNSDFEDWSAATYDGEIQPKGWNASNVTQVGMKFNFAHQEAGHNGGYCMMVKDQDVGAAGITETSPGYFALGQPWCYLPSITEINKATAGTSGGITWTHRPDSMVVWIRRTGNNWDKEDFYLLYYAWAGTTKGDKYTGKNGKCTSHSETNEESDVRLAMNGNECGTTQKGTQIAEGMWRERATYGNWTKMTVPILYFNDTLPTMMNIIFSASNYPNFRANSGLYAGNSLYVDDLQMVYSSKIQELWIQGPNDSRPKKWNGFDPNSTDVQVYSLGEDATQIPSEIQAVRGAGSLTNARGTTKSFPGRVLEVGAGKEMTITPGNLNGTPTLITVTAEDGSSTTTYKILFQKAKSTNAKLAGITVNGEGMTNFSPTKYSYQYELPYGTTQAPTVGFVTADDGQTVQVTPPTSVNGTATLVVTAADGTTKQTYTVQFSVGPLKDNTLQDILINGKSVPGFSPAQMIYKVSLPTTTTSMPTVQAVSAYPDGEQTIVYTAPSVIDGGQYQIAVSSPGNPTPKVYKLNFKLEASSYSLLSDLQVIGDQISDINPGQLDNPAEIAFDPEVTTYYVNLKMGTETMPEIIYTQGDEFQTITMTDGGLDGTTRISVLAGNNSDQTVYKLVFSTAKSEISTLAGIEVGGVALEGFAADVTSYTYVLPVGTTTLPEIRPIPSDEFQKIAMTTGGVNGKTRITVTAGNGNTTNYYISFSVNSFTDNTLASLAVEGIDIAFEPETNEYWVNLPQGTTVLPAVTYTLKDANFQTVSERAITGLNGDYKITVRPQSGASRTYILHFSVATSSNTNLGMIYIGGKALDGFVPETKEYEFHLPEGVSTIPAVTFDKAENGQRVLSVLEGKVQTITVTAESGAKGIYTITFIVQVSQNAFLDMIYLDGEPLANFQSDLLTYTAPLEGATCPAITVDKAAGQQVTITAPYAAGIATIVVKPEEGAANTYTIDFQEAAPEAVRLSNILVNGQSLEGFIPELMTYTASYAGDRPSVEGVKEYAEQQVNLLWKDNVAWLHVQDTVGNKAAYSIAFTKTLSDDNTLEAIYINGALLNGFDSATHHYTDSLEAGSAYPEIAYKAAAKAQVVFFGQLEQGKWGITVMAENGTPATYTVFFPIKPFTDATLINLQADTVTLVPAFDANTFAYTATIDQGAALPQLTAEPREGQSVFLFDTNDSTQQVLVVAENGAEQIYTVTYTRVKSNNVQLADILVDGVSLETFRPEKSDYTITLPRQASVVPNIFPIPALDNQTVTTWFCRPGGVTRIKVVAQDGSEGEYTIAFPLEKSEDTQLKSLNIDGQSKDVATTEFTFNVGFDRVEPYDVLYEAKAGQEVRYVEAPLSGVTQIIVTNEKGTNSRTYSIRYNVAQPQGNNIVKSINYSYVDADGQTVNGSLQPVKGENKIALPFGAKSFVVTNVEKNYTEQSVYFYNGGIRRGAKIIAVANRAGEADAEYTIVPEMPEMKTEGKLQNLTFKGTTVPNFRPDVYNYIVKVTAQPTAADFVGTAFGGKTVTKSALDNKKKQITLTVSGGEKYSVCWFYEDNPYIDFTGDWIPVTQGVGSKPSDKWVAPGDIVKEHTFSIGFGSAKFTLIYTAGKETSKSGNNGVTLMTIKGSSLNSSIPGMMTQGSMAVSLANAGGSTSSVTDDGADQGVVFRNTPEQFTLRYCPNFATEINGWFWRLHLSDGTNTVETKFDGTYDSRNTWKDATKNINYGTLGAIQRVTFTLASTPTTSAKDYSTTSKNYESSISLQDLRFIYNSELTAVKVNGKATSRSGNTFTYTLGQNEQLLGLPTLTFTGAVHDQTQTVEWLNDGEWINGELKAKITNYGENLEDHTDYTLILKRTPVTSLDYTADFGSFDFTEKNDTVFVALPYGTKTLPDMTITPESIHQLITMTKSGNAVTVKVKAENGDEATKVYVFTETKSNDATPEIWSLESGVPETVDVDHLIYAVKAASMPQVEITKKEGQLVDLHYTADSVVFVMTAADGASQLTYTIRREDPSVTTTGQIDVFYKGTSNWPAMGGDDYEADESKPTVYINFERSFAQDSVVHVQSPAGMEWQVYGSANHTYVLTYPTSKSNNAYLADLLIDGVHYADFSATDYTYSIASDTAIVLETVEAEPAQRITTVQTANEEGRLFTTTVTAEDGVTTKEYTFAVRRPKSAVATLSGIMLDSVMITGFDANTFDYTVVLPSAAVKTAEPLMPNITYIAGDAAQTVTLNPGVLNGEPTELYVQAADGSDNTYTLTIRSAPSACVDLTGITVNGAMLEQFEAGRHFYSLSVNTSEIEVDYTSDDRFLTVTVITDTIKEEQQFRYTLLVKAENHDEAIYEVMVYVENRSNDAQLANIYLDGKAFNVFEHALNPDLAFDGGNNDYRINLPSGTTILPEVSAQLKADGQAVQIYHRQDSILLDVTAVDGTTHNIYTLHFLVPQSKNADLSMIFLDGDSLPDFDPAYYFYQIELPVGTHSLPEVVAQKSEAVQTLLPVEIDHDKLQATIRVQAEDQSVRENTYVVVFHFTQSDADTLLAIYQDGKAMENFAPTQLYYTLSLPVGTTAFPELSWMEADEWQTITMDTVEAADDHLIRQISVRSESGKKNLYTVSYNVLKSEIDTLQMIFVDQKQLPLFDANTLEYYYQLTAAEAAALGGELPLVEYIAGDEYQTILVSQALDSLSVNSLRYKSLVTVTAATGKTRTYTIHYPVELSSDASLNMILLGGKPLANFDSERETYKVEIVGTNDIPLVSVIKKEDAQTYEIRPFGQDTVLIDVLAEDMTTTKTYTLVFDRVLSDVTTLQNIILAKDEQTLYFKFNPDVYEYTVMMPDDPDVTAFTIDDLPEIMLTYMDSLQHAQIEPVIISKEECRVMITVIAANGDEGTPYVLTFRYRFSNDATLTDIVLAGTSLNNFDAATWEYTYLHPFGSDSASFFTADSVEAITANAHATYTVTVDEEGTITIRVIAQNEEAENTYRITQKIDGDPCNTLDMIYIDGVALDGFDPLADTLYVYQLVQGTAAIPTVTFDKTKEHIVVEMSRAQPGEILEIDCTAENGSVRTYRIHFLISDVDFDRPSPKAHDVLLCRYSSSQIFVATINKDVAFVLYDQVGRVLNYERLPVADPNTIEAGKNVQNLDVLLNVVDFSAGMLFNIDPGQLYYYSFVEGNGSIIKSGKLIIK